MTETDPPTTVQVPGYRMGPVLGAGSRSCVLRATREGNTQEVAIKAIPLSAFEDSRRPEERFLSAMERVSSMMDPRVARVVDYGIAGQCAYIVHDLIKEGTLMQRVVAGEAIILEHALRLSIGVSEAVGVAHLRGFCHGDLKPSNVLVPSWERPVVMDFGLWGILKDDRVLMATNAMIGSWIYFAPERRQLDPVNTTQSDVFALGALLAYLVTGQEPYDIHNQSVRDELTDGLPEELVGVIRTATQYEPRDRYSDAAAFSMALTQVAARIVGKVSKARRDQLTLTEESALAAGGRGFQAVHSLSDGDMVLIVAEPRIGDQQEQSAVRDGGLLSVSKDVESRGTPPGHERTSRHREPEDALHLPSVASRISVAGGLILIIMSTVAKGGILYRWFSVRAIEAATARQAASSDGAPIVASASVVSSAEPAPNESAREIIIHEKQFTDGDLSPDASDTGEPPHCLYETATRDEASVGHLPSEKKETSSRAPSSIDPDKGALEKLSSLPGM